MVIPLKLKGIYPFYFRVKNKVSFKAMEEAEKEIRRENFLPIQYYTKLTFSGKPLANGETNFFVVATPEEPAEMTDDDPIFIRDFLSWVEETNKLTLSMWDYSHRNDMSDEDKDIVNQFITINPNELDEEDI
jgi:hypothetical protein